MLLNQLVLQLDELLVANRFRDYCPNGLQVQGVQKSKNYFWRDGE